MKGELNLEQLDNVQAQGELSDNDLEGVVGGKGFPVGVSVGGYPGYGYGYGGYRGVGYRGGYGYRGYGRRW